MWFKGGIYKAGVPIRSRWLPVAVLLAFGFASAQNGVMPRENVCKLHKDLKVNIICSTYKITIIGQKYKTVVNLGGDISASKILWGNQLYLEYGTSGALTSVASVLVNLKTGEKMFDLAAYAISYDDKRLVLPYAGYAGWEYLTNPVVYVYQRDKSQLYTYPYIFSSRPGCKPTDEDLDVTVSGFRVTLTQFIFRRKDACGEFDIVKPFPKK